MGDYPPQGKRRKSESTKEAAEADEELGQMLVPPLPFFPATEVTLSWPPSSLQGETPDISARCPEGGSYTDTDKGVRIYRLGKEEKEKNK